MGYNGKSGKSKIPLWFFLEAPIKDQPSDFSSSAPIIVKTTRNLQDNRINWVIPKNFGNFDWDLDSSKTPKLATISSPSTSPTTVKITETIQDHRNYWVIPKIFGKIDHIFSFSKPSNSTNKNKANLPTTTMETFEIYFNNITIVFDFFSKISGWPSFSLGDKISPLNSTWPPSRLSTTPNISVI